LHAPRRRNAVVVEGVDAMVAFGDDLGDGESIQEVWTAARVVEIDTVIGLKTGPGGGEKVITSRWARFLDGWAKRNSASERPRVVS